MCISFIDLLLFCLKELHHYRSSFEEGFEVSYLFSILAVICKSFSIIAPFFTF